VIAPVLADETDIAVGSRFLGTGGYRSSAARRIGIRVLAWVVSTIARQKVTDPTSGFQALNRHAIGLFAGFLDDPEVALVGVEAAGAASLSSGRPAVLHGARSSVLADEDGQIVDAHSISAGLDYPGVGPEHAWLRDTGRARYVTATDEEALAAFHRLAETEGILPALEPAHALARALDLDAELVVVGLSGRGDKDLAQVLDR